MIQKINHRFMTQAKSLESLGDVDLFHGSKKTRGILSFRDDGGICSRQTSDVININSSGTCLEVLATTETIFILAKFGKCRK
jgi:hypothetical protein